MGAKRPFVKTKSLTARNIKNNIPRAIPVHLRIIRVSSLFYLK